MGTVRWRQVAVFYGLACLVAWPFFWLRDMEPEVWRSLRLPGPLRMSLIMWGPGVAALVCLALFRRTHVRTVTLVGSSAAFSLAFYLVPLGVLAAIGLPNREGLSPHVLPLVVVPLTFFTIFGEELGWRGFLQDALRPLPRAWRWVLLGVAWELWHFTNRTAHRAPLEAVTSVLSFLPLTVLLTALIGEAVERSRSLLVAHSLHLWANLVLEQRSWQAYAGLAAACVLWGVLLWRWPRTVAAPAPPPLAPAA